MGTFDELWQYGRTMYVKDQESGEERSFRGFLEPLNLTAAEKDHWTKAGIIAKEKFRLLSEPKESLENISENELRCGKYMYRIIKTKELYIGDELSHKESILLRKAGSLDG